MTDDEFYFEDENMDDGYYIDENPFIENPDEEDVDVDYMFFDNYDYPFQGSEDQTNEDFSDISAVV